MENRPMRLYLAAPYSHDDPFVKRCRLLAVNRVAYDLMSQGYIVFSPLSHSVGIEEVATETKDWGFWKRQDFEWLRLCDECVVLKLSGWSFSIGVQDEIREAKVLGIRVTYISEEQIKEMMAYDRS